MAEENYKIELYTNGILWLIKSPLPNKYNIVIDDEFTKNEAIELVEWFLSKYPNLYPNRIQDRSCSGYELVNLCGKEFYVYIFWGLGLHFSFSLPSSYENGKLVGVLRTNDKTILGDSSIFSSY